MTQASARPAVRRAIARLGLCALAACSQPAVEGALEKDVAAIHAAHAALDEAARDGDYAGWSRLLTADAVVMPPGRPAIRDERGRRDLFDGRPEGLEGGSELLEVEVRGDLAFVWGRYRLSGTGPDGPIEDSGNMLEIWRRQPDGGWLLARDLWNSDLPAPRAREPGRAAVAATPPGTASAAPRRARGSTARSTCRRRRSGP